MADQSRQTSQKLYESAPVSYRATKFLIAVTIGAALFVLSCLTLTGTVLAVIMATPVLVLFSPVLLPAGIVLFPHSLRFCFVQRVRHGGRGAILVVVYIHV
ncbi:hypothetical protein EV1_042896 [Malus domestica]